MKQRDIAAIVGMFAAAVIAIGIVCNLLYSYREPPIVAALICGSIGGFTTQQAWRLVTARRQRA